MVTEGTAFRQLSNRERAFRLLYVPLLIGYLVTDRREVVDADVSRWREVLREDYRLADLLARPEFRTLYFHRLRHGNLAGAAFQKLIKIVYHPQITLYLGTAEIGPGLYIQHGFSTIISAAKIGARCWINQQVTIGWRDESGAPVLEDGVTIGAGAIVLGPITLGENCRVGAGAIVVRDVPAGSTALGLPAHRVAGPAGPES